MKTVKLKKQAFTLVELLVTLAVISLLMSIMLPCLGMAKSQCHATICRSNIRQLYIANTGYSLNNDDYYVLAAKDIFTGSGGRHRWHGVRQNPYPSVNDPFDPPKGPLKSYLQDGEVKECPSKVNYIKEGVDAFEAGGGGYGYNLVGIGSRNYRYGYCDKATRSSMKITEIEKPYKKVMFTDTAYIKKGQLIEYSFCEPPLFVLDFGNGIQEFAGVAPSIHFRHFGKTTVAWCDGHITAEKLDFPPNKKTETDEFKIGWFGPNNNSLFRPK